MNIVTSGAPYIDIDAYAGIIAEAEFQRAQGREARAVSTAPWNESITETIRSWPAEIGATYEPNTDDTYTLVDISDPDYFEKFVSLDRVEAVIDHHTGFEQFWQEQLGDGASIDFIGAACTLVYERWQRAWKLGEMSKTAAGLLLAGILDNTLNLGAEVTTNRDRTAHDDLLVRSGLPADWNMRYFAECQSTIEADISQAIANDTKMLGGKLPEAVGQITVWDTARLLTDKRDVIAQTLSDKSAEWAINLIDISKSRSYFLVGNPDAERKLSEVLGLTFDDGLAEADRLWLRKEIIKKSEQ